MDYRVAGDDATVRTEHVKRVAFLSKAHRNSGYKTATCWGNKTSSCRNSYFLCKNTSKLRLYSSTSQCLRILIEQGLLIHGKVSTVWQFFNIFVPWKSIPGNERDSCRSRDCLRPFVCQSTGVSCHARICIHLMNALRWSIWRIRHKFVFSSLGVKRCNRTNVESVH